MGNDEKKDDQLLVRFLMKRWGDDEDPAADEDATEDEGEQAPPEAPEEESEQPELKAEVPEAPPEPEAKPEAAPPPKAAPKASAPAAKGKAKAKPKAKKKPPAKKKPKPKAAAKKTKMSEEDLEAAGVGGGGNRGMILIIVAIVMLNFLAMGGLAAFFLLREDKAAAEAPTKMGDESEEPGSSTPVGAVKALVEMRPIVANLRDKGGRRYVKILTFLEVADEATKELVTGQLVLIRNEMLIYFSGMDVESTIGSEEKTRIREEIKLLVNKTLGKELIKRVFFTEFVVQ